MLCERCNKNPVAYIQEENINGKVVSYHLCKSCYAELFGSLNSALNGDILAGLFAPAPERRISVCPVCGMDYTEFEKTGLLGCAACYDVFKDQLLPYIKRIQGKVEHVGKVGLDSTEQEFTRILNSLQEQMEKAYREGRKEDAQKIYSDLDGMITRMKKRKE